MKRLSEPLSKKTCYTIFKYYRIEDTPLLFSLFVNQAERFELGIQGIKNADSIEKSLAQNVGNFERSIILDALNQHNGKLTKTADALNIIKNTLFDKLNKFSLKY